MRKLLFCLASLLAFVTSAQSIKTDYGVYPEPAPPPLPAAGGTFVDSVFGTTLLRVTDTNDGSDNHQSYSYWPSFNKNSTLLYISSVGGSPTLYDFDTLNFSISNKRALFAGNPPGDGAPNAEDAIWSGQHANIMLCHTAQKLYSYNTSNSSYTLIHDFGTAYPNIFLQQMSRSVNDTTFAFTYKENINYTNIGYIVLRASNNQADTGNMATLDEVQVDKTGNYLVIKTGQSGAGVIEVEILDLLNGNKQYLTDNGPDYAPGHSDNGTGFVIGADNWNNAYTFRTLTNPHTFYNVIDYNNDWSQGTHVSMLADDESWLLVSSFIANTLPSTGIFSDEIYQVATDGSKAVRRLCHHHSDYLNQTNFNDQYWSEPKANVSRNGKYAVFTSNWGSTSRRDVFVLQIPAANTAGLAGREEEKYLLYPNPAIDKIRLVMPANMQPCLLEITDILGKIMFSKKVNVNTEDLDISGLPEGIYFLHAGAAIKKFAVVR